MFVYDEWRGLARIMMEHVVNKKIKHTFKNSSMETAVYDVAKNRVLIWDTFLRSCATAAHVVCCLFSFQARSAPEVGKGPWIIYECDSLIDGKISQFSPTRKFPFVDDVVRILSLPTMRHIFLSIEMVRCEFLIFFSTKKLKHAAAVSND